MVDQPERPSSSVVGVCVACGGLIEGWPCAVTATGELMHSSCLELTLGLEDAQEGGLELLSDDERASVERIVRALVHNDEEDLRRVVANPESLVDIYLPTRRWRLWDKVDLSMPPGDSTLWEATVVGRPERGWSVNLQMWTVQEQGPSELTLHLDVTGPEVLYKGMWS